MQSGPSRVTPDSTSNNASSVLQPSSQHGYHFDDDSGDDGVSGHALLSGSGHTQSPVSGDSDPDVVGLEGSLRDGSPFDKSPSAVDRITEYESAAIFSTPKREREFGFKVVPSRQSPASAGGATVENFPNEVLTHILSHLPPGDLSSMSLVSSRIHSLVTTPHAWRIAFSRYFTGPASLLTQDGRNRGSEEFERVLLQRRSFARLTALASWRNEYILRTRLLRSLSRGRPAEHPLPGRSTGASGSGTSQSPNAVVTYNSLLLYPVTHMDCKFGSGIEKRLPHFIHGASEQGTASISEPMVGKVGAGSWGISDPQLFNHFGDLFPGDPQWGLEQGELVGVPNTMDVSQPFGMVYGEGCPPRGRVYFISSSEKRGRFLSSRDASPNPHLGIPDLNVLPSVICSVWIAKSAHIPELTLGVCGILAGSSSGILTAYSLGPHPSYHRRFDRGQVTARWVLSPGVPIVSIVVDDNYSTKRQSQQRIWAVALNALGEVFYVTDTPSQPAHNPGATADELDQAAWVAGRSVHWKLVESTRRTAQPDPHSTLPVDGSYSPQSSSSSMGLTRDQVAAETKEIERFLAFKPARFREVCRGWDMQRKLEVDFAGDDLNGAGESIVVISCGVIEGSRAAVHRYTRLKHSVGPPHVQDESFPRLQPEASETSLFGGSGSPNPGDLESEPLSRSSSTRDNNAQLHPAIVEWRTSNLILDVPQTTQILVATLDISTFAQVTTSEDPLLAMCGTSGSSSSSPPEMSSPLWHSKKPTSRADLPGQGARFISVGTSQGTIFVWDIRAAVSQNPDISNDIHPVRIIKTDSPRVSALAMTSLYLVHGGNDGLVQAWDPLASSTQPVRTLNSRFSSRARRHLAQAQASLQGVGNNYFAAGAIRLDPDPTRLRGVVALGTHLRYWSYSSFSADQYKSSKRRLRYSQRGSNSSPATQKFIKSRRGALQDYILNERRESEREKSEREKENARLRGRFGLDLLGPGASEEDVLAYACMLSEEAYTSDETKIRGSESSSSSDTIAPKETPAPKPPTPSNSAPVAVLDPADEEMDPDVAEALRRSLEDASPIPSNPQTAEDTEGSPFGQAESSTRQEEADMEFAVQLSMAEQRSLESQGASVQEDEDGFPLLGSGNASSPPSRQQKDRKGKDAVRE